MEVANRLEDYKSKRTVFMGRLWAEWPKGWADDNVFSTLTLSLLNSEGKLAQLHYFVGFRKK